jgi:hypothetical protein
VKKTLTIIIILAVFNGLLFIYYKYSTEKPVAGVSAEVCRTPLSELIGAGTASGGIAASGSTGNSTDIQLGEVPPLKINLGGNFPNIPDVPKNVVEKPLPPLPLPEEYARVLCDISLILSSDNSRKSDRLLSFQAALFPGPVTGTAYETEDGSKFSLILKDFSINAGTCRFSSVRFSSSRALKLPGNELIPVILSDYSNNFSLILGKSQTVARISHPFTRGEKAYKVSLSVDLTLEEIALIEEPPLLGAGSIDLDNLIADWEKGKEEKWGETVNGLRAQIRLKRAKINPGEDIFVDYTIQNIGNSPLLLWRGKQDLIGSPGGDNPDMIVIEKGSSRFPIKGRRIGKEGATGAIWLGAGQQYTGSYLLGKQIDNSFNLTPGKYRLDFCYKVQEGTQTEDGRKVWTGEFKSNMVHLEVLSPSDKKAK